MDKQSGQREDVPSQDEYIAVYGQTVRGNSPFWYEYGQSVSGVWWVGKALTRNPSRRFHRVLRAGVPCECERKVSVASRPGVLYGGLGSE